MKKSFMLLSLFLLLWLSTEVFAQCGASVSSCKNCHEVQGKMKVNNKGAWHKQHSFGDFCEFCHGGNVQSQDKLKAHQGMEDPMADVKVSCSSCHAADLMDRAQKYASILHVDLSQPVAREKTPAVQEVEKTDSTPATVVEKPSKSVAPATTYQAGDNEIVDFNNLATTQESGAAGTTSHVGDWIVFFLILLVGVVFIGLWYYFNRETVSQKIKEVQAQWGSEEYQIAAKEESIDLEFDELKLDPNRQKLFRYMKDCDAETVHSLSQLLAHGKDGEELIQKVGQLDPQLLHSIRKLDEAQLSLLLALR